MSRKVIEVRQRTQAGPENWKVEQYLSHVGSRSLEWLKKIITWHLLQISTPFRGTGLSHCPYWHAMYLDAKRDQAPLELGSREAVAGLNGILSIAEHCCNTAA